LGGCTGDGVDEVDVGEVDFLVGVVQTKLHVGPTRAHREAHRRICIHRFLVMEYSAKQHRSVDSDGTRVDPE